MSNMIIIGLYILAIIAILCFTIYKIKIINSPVMPRKLLWLNDNIFKLKNDIKNMNTEIKESIHILDKDVKDLINFYNDTIK